MMRPHHLMSRAPSSSATVLPLRNCTERNSAWYLEGRGYLIYGPFGAQQQHQFDPRLVTRQQSAQDRPAAFELFTAAFVGISVQNPPARTARRDDDGNARLYGPLDLAQRCDRDVAASQAFDDQPARAVFKQVPDQAPDAPGGELYDLDPLLEPGHRDVRARSKPTRHYHAILIDKTQRPEVAALKCFQRFGMRLGGLGRGE